MAGWLSAVKYGQNDSVENRPVGEWYHHNDIRPNAPSGVMAFGRSSDQSPERQWFNDLLTAACLLGTRLNKSLWSRHHKNHYIMQMKWRPAGQEAKEGMWRWTLPVLVDRIPWLRHGWQAAVMVCEAGLRCSLKDKTKTRHSSTETVVVWHGHFVVSTTPSLSTLYSYTNRACRVSFSPCCDRFVRYAHKTPTMRNYFWGNVFMDVHWIKNKVTQSTPNGQMQSLKMFVWQDFDRFCIQFD